MKAVCSQLTAVALIVTAGGTLAVTALRADPNPTPPGASSDATGVNAVLPSDNTLGAVLIYGSRGMCTGVPVRNTNMVFTVAHCLVAGHPTTMNAIFGGPVRVAAGSTSAYAQQVRIPSRYFHEGHVSSDAAVLYTDQVWHQGIDTWGNLDVWKDVTMAGGVTAYGWHNPATRSAEPDTDDVITTEVNALSSTPPPASGFVECITEQLAIDFQDDGTYHIPCDLRPGSSGGPVVINERGMNVLVGVISSYHHQPISNGIAPVELFDQMVRGDQTVQIELEVPPSATAPAVYAPTPVVYIDTTPELTDDGNDVLAQWYAQIYGSDPSNP